MRNRVRNFIESNSSGYEWWCEPICFFDDPNKPQQLAGNTKLFILLDDPAIDSFMAHADAMKIVELLSSASRDFGIAWNLYLEGSPVGRISEGALDQDAASSLNSLLEICSLMGVDPAGLNREEVLASHADR